MNALCFVASVNLREIEIYFTINIIFNRRGENFSIRVIVQAGTANPFSAFNAESYVCFFADNPEFFNTV